MSPNGPAIGEVNGIDFDHFFHVLLRHRRVTD